MPYYKVTMEPQEAGTGEVETKVVRLKRKPKSKDYLRVDGSVWRVLSAKRLRPR